MKKIPQVSTLKRAACLALCLGSVAPLFSWAGEAPVPSTAGPVGAFQENAPEVFIRRLLGTGVSILNEVKMPVPEKETRFITLFRDNFHLKSIAGSTLRPGESRTAAPETLSRFLQLFEAMVFRVYMKQIEQLSLNGFAVTSIVEQGDGAKIVKSVIERKDSPEPFKVDWLLYDKEGRLWVFDVTVDGVSLGQVQRQKIQDIRQGGDLSALLESMEREYASGVQK